MKEIVLDNLVPCVFSALRDIGGDIWHRHVVLERGSVYLLEAASGTGKSSLCGFLMGYRRDYIGTILFDGKDARHMKQAEWTALRREHVSLLFQELRLFPELTAMENVMVKNQLTHFKKEKEIKEWFEMLDLDDKVHEPIGRMSYGQQQRVAMIRALCQPFDFLLADEPVSHLDEENGRLMAELMMHEVRRQGAAVLVTSIGKHLELPYDKTFGL